MKRVNWHVPEVSWRPTRDELGSRVSIFNPLDGGLDSSDGVGSGRRRSLPGGAGAVRAASARGQVLPGGPGRARRARPGVVRLGAGPRPVTARRRSAVSAVPHEDGSSGVFLAVRPFPPVCGATGHFPPPWYTCPQTPAPRPRKVPNRMRVCRYNWHTACSLGCPFQ